MQTLPPTKAPPSRAIAPTALQRGLAADLAQLGRRGCECIGCASRFLGVPAFDAHRVGRHGRDRRCATPAEMVAAGLAPDERGVWTWAAEIGKPRRKPVFHPAGPSGTLGTAKTGLTATARRIGPVAA